MMLCSGVKQDGRTTKSARPTRTRHAPLWHASIARRAAAVHDGKQEGGRHELPDLMHQLVLTIRCAGVNHGKRHQREQVLQVAHCGGHVDVTGKRLSMCV